MLVPQLVQEIIDYYLYFGQWKAKIAETNKEFHIQLMQHDAGGVYVTFVYGYFSYCTRRLDEIRCGLAYETIFSCNFHNAKVSHAALLPKRYYYSNTKEQLKSLFVSPDY